MKAGKDIYCEKPLTLTIDEGQAPRQGPKADWPASCRPALSSGATFISASPATWSNERIGKLEKVEVWLPAGLRQGPFAKRPVPSGFDYDFWLGQTAR